MPLCAQSVAEWQTSMGMFRAVIREDLVPITGENFINLANDNFYDGLIFHRIIDGFVIQDGDPTGTGGGGPGWTIPLEIHPDLRHDTAGALAMARSANPNSAGSQYYFTLSPQPGLDDNYAVFGKVIEGIETVLEIGHVPTDSNDRPITPVEIYSIEILGTIYPGLEMDHVVLIEDESNSDGDGVFNPYESALLSIALENLAGWGNAAHVTATLTCSDTRLTIENPTVNYGDIAGGDSSINTDQPFRILSEFGETFTASANLHLSANGETDYPYENDYEVLIDVSLNQPGWPYYLGRSSFSSPVIIDIDLDGSRELIFGDGEGYLHALTYDGVTELPGFPVDLGQEIRAAVAIGNLDQDAELEIVAGTFGNELYAIDHTGETLFSYSTVGQVVANPMIADVDGDGSPEIIAITIAGVVSVLDSNGENYPNFPLFTGSVSVISPAIADLDGDGYLDILVFVGANSDASLLAISTADGQNIGGWPINVGTNSENGPVVTDFEEDGLPEVLIGLANGNLSLFNSDGSQRWARDLGSDVAAAPAVADIDLADNGEMEIVAISDDGLIYILDKEGNDLYSSPFDADASVRSSPILADLNGNGTIDVIFGDNEGNINAVDIDGSLLSGFPIQVGGNLNVSPAIGYLDGDDDVEIAIPNYDSYCVIDYKSPATIVWPCYKGSPTRTGYTADITAIEDQPENPSGDVENFLGASYPNPFLPGIQSGSSVAIRFGLARSADVSLIIYDVAGRRIKSLGLGVTPAGNHQIKWDGIDRHGRKAVSGVYLYRMKSKDFEDTKRMVLIR